jgi:hypothetical protein
VRATRDAHARLIAFADPKKRDRPFRNSSNIEVEDQRDKDIDRPTREASRFESPLACGKNRLFVQSAIQGTSDSNVGGPAVGLHDELEHDRAVDLLGQRFGRVRRLHRTITLGVVTAPPGR